MKVTAKLVRCLKKDPWSGDSANHVSGPRYGNIDRVVEIRTFDGGVKGYVLAGFPTENCFNARCFEPLNFKDQTS